MANLVDGLSIVIIVAIASGVLAPTFVWLLTCHPQAPKQV